MRYNPVKGHFGFLAEALFQQFIKDEDSDDYENVSDDDYEECSEIEIDMELNGFSNTCSADDFR